MNKRQFEEISKWQNETFGQATSLSKIAHLAEELQELVGELKMNSEKRRLEFADCFILLFGAAASDGMSYEKILEAIEEKMLINYQRKWGKPATNGVYHHIKNPFACYGDQKPHPMDFDSSEEYQQRIEKYLQWERDNLDAKENVSPACL